MEGLFIVIAIVLGIFDFAAKQQKKQAQNNRQHSQGKQSTVLKQKNIPQPLKRAIMGRENTWGKGMKGETEYMPVAMPTDDYEGIEIEDRKKPGSLEYIEQSQSLEGVCDEHPEFEHQKTKVKMAAQKAVSKEVKEDIIFDLTEDNLLRSVVMAEVLGPPRAMKRRIR